MLLKLCDIQCYVVTTIVIILFLSFLRESNIAIKVHFYVKKKNRFDFPTFV